MPDHPHPILQFRDSDWVDAIPSLLAERADAELRRQGFGQLADHAAELRRKWTRFTGNAWVLEVRRAAQTLVRFTPVGAEQIPWRLFLFACDWRLWPTEAFPPEWDPWWHVRQEQDRAEAARGG